MKNEEDHEKETQKLRYSPQKLEKIFYFYKNVTEKNLVAEQL